jgi:hypothetical protein
MHLPTNGFGFQMRSVYSFVLTSLGAVLSTKLLRQPQIRSGFTCHVRRRILQLQYLEV